MLGVPRRRLLFIVSRERADLYDALRKTLWHEPGVEVILDRRHAERRIGEDPPPEAERRAGRRRERLPVDAEVRECGWAVVKISTWPEAHRQTV